MSTSKRDTLIKVQPAELAVAAVDAVKPRSKKMTAEQSRESDYMTKARAAARKVWEGVVELKSLQAEWQAQDYGSTLSEGVGANEGITGTMIGAAVFATGDALESLMASGHATNLTDVI